MEYSVLLPHSSQIVQKFLEFVVKLLELELHVSIGRLSYRFLPDLNMRGIVDSFGQHFPFWLRLALKHGASNDLSPHFAVGLIIETAGFVPR